MHILDGAIAMPFVSLDTLVVAVRAVALSGAVVLVAYDEVSQRLTVYQQKAWFRAGGLRTEDDVSEEGPENGVGESGSSAVQVGDESSTQTSWPGPGAPATAWPPDYEQHGSDRRSSASVVVGFGEWWSAELVVPMSGDQSVLLTIERGGVVPEGAPSTEEVSLVILPGEADAVVQLVSGIVAQARRDGVLRDSVPDSARMAEG